MAGGLETPISDRFRHEREWAKAIPVAGAGLSLAPFICWHRRQDKYHGCQRATIPLIARSWLILQIVICQSSIPRHCRLDLACRHHQAANQTSIDSDYWAWFERLMSANVASLSCLIFCPSSANNLISTNLGLHDVTVSPLRRNPLLVAILHLGTGAPPDADNMFDDHSWSSWRKTKQVAFRSHKHTG